MGAKTFLDRIKARGWRHWAVVALLLVIVVPLTPEVDDALGLRQAQCWTFQQFGEIAPRPLEPRYIRLVMIGDDAYYGPELRHRKPIRRDYLAKLVDHLVSANAAVIALDFDLRLPFAERGSAPGDFGALNADYPDEIRLFVQAIVRAAETRPVVLPKTIGRGHDGGYASWPDIYQAYGLCTRVKADGSWENPGTPELPLSPRAKANISCGYIQLPYDMCQIAPRLDIGHAGKIDSFSLAVARAWNAAQARNVGDVPYFGTYLSPAVLDDPEITVSASGLIAGDPKALSVLRFKPVVVGAHWHKDAAGSGPMIDMHWTPVGLANGTTIHESFAEAILDGRLYSPLPHWMRYVLEIIVSVLAAFLLAAYTSTWSKVGVFAGFVIALPLIQWLVLQLLGTDFQALPPLIGLFLHSLVERPVDEGFGKVLAIRWPWPKPKRKVPPGGED